MRSSAVTAEPAGSEPGCLGPPARHATHGHLSLPFCETGVCHNRVKLVQGQGEKMQAEQGGDEGAGSQHPALSFTVWQL